MPEHGEGVIKPLRWWTNFVRWDAIYFIQIAHRGVLFEQEWAFGWGFAKLLTLVGRGMTCSILYLGTD